MRVVDFIAKRLHFLGVTEAYMVTGGAAMHLNDAISRVYADSLHFLHHEQSCAIAAESFARITNQPCLVNVTAGPGGINAINGVFGAFVDSIPMIIISGQIKTEHLVKNINNDCILTVKFNQFKLFYCECLLLNRDLTYSFNYPNYYKNRLIW